jgi:hypothetical protein
LKAFDNKNKVISEDEFINKLQKARVSATINLDGSSTNEPLRDKRPLTV